MKRSLHLFSAVCLACAVAILAVACSPFPEAKPGRRFQIIWPTEEGDYRIQRVHLDTFTEPHRLKGEVASLIVEPRLGGAGIEGEAPVGRFIEASDGTLIPADFITHQGVVVYAHMERLKKFDDALGVGGEGFIWPARIGLRANVVDGQGPLQNNAVYDGTFNALFLVPYTDADLPITLNGGVLAHERFHAIFQYHVLSRLGVKWQAPDEVGHTLLHACGLDENEPGVLRSTRSFSARSEGGKADREVSKLEYNRFLVRGLNEGFADFWGWVYSGDAGFIRKSLRAAGEVRDLGQPMDPLPSERTIRSSLWRLSNPRARSSLSYTFGSHYARFLRRLAEDRAAGGDERAARLEVARALVRALPKIAAAFEAGFDDEFIAPDVALRPLFEAMADVRASTCLIYDDFVGHGGARSRPEACPRRPDPEFPSSGTPAAERLESERPAPLEPEAFGPRALEPETLGRPNPPGDER